MARPPRDYERELREFMAARRGVSFEQPSSYLKRMASAQRRARERGEAFSAQRGRGHTEREHLARRIVTPTGEERYSLSSSQRAFLIRQRNRYNPSSGLNLETGERMFREMTNQQRDEVMRLQQEIRRRKKIGTLENLYYHVLGRIPNFEYGGLHLFFYK